MNERVGGMYRGVLARTLVESLLVELRRLRFGRDERTESTRWYKGPFFRFIG